MRAHTPGPWLVGVGGMLHANRVWTADMKPVVNLCSFGDSPPDIDSTAQANARLIAAAPELLEALETAHFTLSEVLAMTIHSGIRQTILDRMKTVRAAIAKATA